MNMEEEVEDGEDHPHPLLNHVVLKTLVPYLHPGDVPTFRNTCTSWHHSVTPRFKEEFTVDLTGNNNVVSSRKTARFMYAVSPSSSPNTQAIPFDSFKLSETRLGLASLDRGFLTQLVPQIRRLQLVTRNRSLPHFWALLRKLEKLEELELGLNPDPDLSTSSQNDTHGADNNLCLHKLWYIKWLNPPETGEDWPIVDEDMEGDALMSPEFLSGFYRAVQGSLQHLSLPSLPAWRHLMALSSTQSPQRLNSLQLGTVMQRDLEMLQELSDGHGLRLMEFRCSAIAADVRQGILDVFLENQSPLLKLLHIGWTTKDRTDVLNIVFPQVFPNLHSLSLKIASKMRYKPILFSEKFPQLKDLHVTLKDKLHAGERIYFWDDLVLARTPPQPVFSMWKLELVGVPLRCAESLHEIMELFPNVRNLTLGRPSKPTLIALWSLWPNLRELRIISACPHIDEALTGIPTTVCRRLLMERKYEEADPELLRFLNGNVPSIRDMKHLQHLEINSRLHSKLQTLSCLPSDVSVYFAFTRMPELRRVVVHRSLISTEAYFHLQHQIPSWGTVQVEQIKLKFDESIDAFQFHRNTQRLMEMLCRYPHQDLQGLPSFLTSLWMESQLGL